MKTLSRPNHFSVDLVQRFDHSGPRYTSYPTADRFVEAFSADDYARSLRMMVQRPHQAAAPLSVYLHVPFCESLCYYCGCNKLVTRHHERVKPYLHYLTKEIELHTKVMGAGKPVSQLHLGGGTPTFLTDEELDELMSALSNHFDLTRLQECSIEVDPRTVSPARLHHLAVLGFNRLSFGVQDFNPEVQRAVHRIQPADQVFDLVAAARNIGFESINVDLIYGLPLQTPDSFAQTIEQVAVLRPDRIAMYAYAHLPERFKPQRRIVAADLPAPAEKLQMFAQALKALLDAGYEYIGMDHFALPGDALAAAKREGRLHRNFQGYSTQPDCDLIGLGVSAIGKVGACYSQNAKTLDEYYDLLEQGALPVVRGLALSRDDLVRRAVINSIMCQGRLDFEAIEQAYLIDFPRYFESELVELRQLRSSKLLQMDDQELQVSPRGWYVVRAIAMVFDRYLQADRARAKYSRII
jgi:oxygen-independent coproporphyrinogen III oxidase